MSKASPALSPAVAPRSMSPLSDFSRTSSPTPTMMSTSSNPFSSSSARTTPKEHPIQGPRGPAVSTPKKAVETPPVVAPPPPPVEPSPILSATSVVDLPNDARVWIRRVHGIHGAAHTVSLPFLDATSGAAIRDRGHPVATVKFQTKTGNDTLEPSSPNLLTADGTASSKNYTCYRAGIDYGASGDVRPFQYDAKKHPAQLHLLPVTTVLPPPSPTSAAAKSTPPTTPRGGWKSKLPEWVRERVNSVSKNSDDAGGLGQAADLSLDVRVALIALPACKHHVEVARENGNPVNPADTELERCSLVLIPNVRYLHRLKSLGTKRKTLWPRRYRNLDHDSSLASSHVVMPRANSRSVPLEAEEEDSGFLEALLRDEGVVGIEWRCQTQADRDMWVQIFLSMGAALHPTAGMNPATARLLTKTPNAAGAASSPNNSQPSSPTAVTTTASPSPKDETKLTGIASPPLDPSTQFSQLSSRQGVATVTNESLCSPTLSFGSRPGHNSSAALLAMALSGTGGDARKRKMSKRGVARSNLIPKIEVEGASSEDEGDASTAGEASPSASPSPKRNRIVEEVVPPGYIDVMALVRAANEESGEVMAAIEGSPGMRGDGMQPSSSGGGDFARNLGQLSGPELEALLMLQQQKQLAEQHDKKTWAEMTASERLAKIAIEHVGPQDSPSVIMAVQAARLRPNDFKDPEGSNSLSSAAVEASSSSPGGTQTSSEGRLAAAKKRKLQPTVQPMADATAVVEVPKSDAVDPAKQFVQTAFPKLWALAAQKKEAATASPSSPGRTTGCQPSPAR